jgi:hypothetical protein
METERERLTMKRKMEVCDHAMCSTFCRAHSKAVPQIKLKENFFQRKKFFQKKNFFSSKKERNIYF